MKKICFIVILFFITINLQAVSLLDSGLHSRATGMGNAFSALADDSSAVYYNPALLYDIEKHLISFGYSHMFLNANNYSVSYVFPKLSRKPDIGLSAAFNSLFDSELKTYSAVDIGNPGDYIAGPDFDFSEYMFILGAGMKIGNYWMMQFSGGLSLKYYSKTIAEYKANGIGADLGFNAKHRLFNFAIVFKNLLGSLKSNNEYFQSETIETVPLSIKTGILLRIKRIINALSGTDEKSPSYDRSSVVREYFRWVVNPVFDAEFVFDDSMSVNTFAGLEGWINDIFALRFGYNNFQGFSYGFSGQVEPVRIDYSYSAHSDLEGTHRITGTYYF